MKACFITVVLIVIIVIILLMSNKCSQGEIVGTEGIEGVEVIEDLPVSDDIDEIVIPTEDHSIIDVGFGTGPGLYGSGRYTSEMVGN